MIVCFDLDGTLVDSAPDIHAAVSKLLVAEGLAPLPLETVRSFIGEGTRVLTGRVIAAAGADPAWIDEWHEVFLHHYEADPASRTQVFPGAREALEALAASGHRLGLCTNKPSRATGLLLDALGFGAAFEAVTGGDTLPERKPSPLPVLHTVAQLGGGQALFVGDSEIDAAAAHAARVPFALFTGGYSREPLDGLAADFRFAHWADLPGMVAALWEEARQT